MPGEPVADVCETALRRFDFVLPDEFDDVDPWLAFKNGRASATARRASRKSFQQTRARVNLRPARAGQAQ